jgi:hypothetical protein
VFFGNLDICREFLGTISGRLILMWNSFCNVKSLSQL